MHRSRPFASKSYFIYILVECIQCNHKFIFIYFLVPCHCCVGTGLAINPKIIQTAGAISSLLYGPVPKIKLEVAARLFN